MLRRVRLPTLVLLVGCAGCAGGADAGPEGPPLLFVRPRGVWTPEELHRDVSECIDVSHAAVVADPGQLEAPPGTARAALRERVVACMDERGWATGSSVEPEEWAQ
jgi:hypothetical protein